MKKDLELAKKSAYIFLILGFFISTSFAKSGFIDFLMRSCIGIVVILLFINGLFPKLISYNLTGCSCTQLEFEFHDENMADYINKIKKIGLERKEEVYKGFILDCEARIKFINDENRTSVAIITFELNKRKIIQSEQSEIVLSWIRNIFDSAGRSGDLSPDIINNMLSDYLELRKVNFRFLISIIVILATLLATIIYGKQIISFFDDHPWTAAIMIGLISILKYFYDKMISRRGRGVGA